MGRATIVTKRIHSKPGKPQRFFCTDEIIAKVEQLASQQMLERDIATCINLAPQTFSEYKSKYPALNEAVKRGYAKGLDDVTAALLEAAKQRTGTTDRIFYLKCKGGWRENGDSATTQENDRQLVLNRIQTAIEKLGDRPGSEAPNDI